MKVIILGSGVIGVSTAYLPGESRASGNGGRSPERRRAGDQLRQCRPSLTRLLGSLGGSRHSAQGAEVAVHEAQPAGDLAQTRSGHVDVGPEHAAQLHVSPV
jgi:hypothetical protein